jgi:hypothetical protein
MASCLGGGAMLVQDSVSEAEFCLEKREDAEESNRLKESNLAGGKRPPLPAMEVREVVVDVGIDEDAGGDVGRLF